MYEQFYGFREQPFSLMPDPEFLYLGDRHSEALSLLEYGLLHRAGMVLITGQIGCGKTTLIRRLLKNQESEFVVGNITNTHHSFGELLKWVALAFGLDYRGKEKVELYEALLEFLKEQHAVGKRVVLVIDEAQNLTSQALEELRMLSNINVDKDQLLQIILVGQPELRELLLDPSLKQLAQRISVDYYLEPLSPRETFEYIRHRLAVSGGDPDLFDIEAVREVFLASQGIPRLINTICDTALVYGYAEQAKRISGETVAEVIRDKTRGNILPIAHHRPGVANPVTEMEHVVV